jgi:hypothetical protein
VAISEKAANARSAGPRFDGNEKSEPFDPARRWSELAKRVCIPDFGVSHDMVNSMKNKRLLPIAIGRGTAIREYSSPPRCGGEALSSILAMAGRKDDLGRK